MSINKERQARVQEAIKKGQWKLHTPIEMAPALAKAYAEKKANLEPHNNHEASHDETDKSSEASTGTPAAQARTCGEGDSARGTRS